MSDNVERDLENAAEGIWARIVTWGKGHVGTALIIASVGSFLVGLWVRGWFR